MTKTIAQASGLLLLALQIACTADHAPNRTDNSSNSSVLSEQAALVRSVLRNSSTPTQEQITALQSSDSHNEFIHDEVPFELWHFFGFTSDEQNQRLAHSTRVTRLNVRSDKPDTSASSWDFTDVMVLESDIVDTGTAKRHARQHVERVALGLAGINTNSNKVWVGSTSIEKLSGPAYTVQANPEENGCFARYQLDLPINESSTHEIEAVQVNCRDSSVLRSAVQTSASSMQATLINDASDKKSDGRAWLVQGWGWPLDNENAAVVFDRAWLVLNDEYEIQLQQTKRRSGKGPKTTTGTLWSISSDTSARPVEDLAVQWTTKRTGSAIQWHITSTSPIPPRIDIVVEQVVETVMSTDTRWFGAVKITGSHQGLGFVDYQPL